MANWQRHSPAGQYLHVEVEQVNIDVKELQALTAQDRNRLAAGGVEMRQWLLAKVPSVVGKQDNS
jgi:hypothetical protein